MYTVLKEEKYLLYDWFIAVNSLEKEAYILSKLMKKLLPSVHKSFQVIKKLIIFVIKESGF